MYTPAFYELPADVRTKISIYNALTPEQREDRYEDALQRQMEDSWDEYDPTEYEDEDDLSYPDCDVHCPGHASECDEYCQCHSCRVWQLADIDHDLYFEVKQELDPLLQDIAIFEQQVRALIGGTCTALVPYDRYYPPVLELECAMQCLLKDY